MLECGFDLLLRATGFILSLVLILIYATISKKICLLKVINLINYN